jgi:hypothetical protein
VQFKEVELITDTDAQLCVPTLTVVAGAKPLPLIKIAVPPDMGPLLGEKLVIEGPAR